MKIFFKKISIWVNRLLDVPSSDPDDARRRKLLNIILVGFIILSVIMFTYLVGLWFTQTHDWWLREAQKLFFATTGLLVGSILLFALNRFIKGWLTSSLFLLFMTIAITFVDQPYQLVAGRSEFLFTLPIILASMLMPSWAAFIATGLDIVIMTYLAYQLNDSSILLAPSFLAFGFIALLAWLSSRSVEVALRDLRRINANLDQLVQERTKDLANALSRVRVEAGRSRAILESIADGVVVFDTKGAATITNPSIVNLLEMSQDSILGSTVDDISQSRALGARDRGTLAGLLTNPGQQSINYRIRWGRKTLSVTSAQVKDEEDNRLGTVAVFRDYTHEAEVERMKNTFLAIVSHELRTPLNAILGYGEMLKEAVYGAVNEKQVRAADRIMGNSRRLLDIVNDLLDQARMEAGKLSLHKAPFRPSDLVDNIHGVMDKIAADKGLAFTSELDPALPEFIIGDIARLQQILVNLVNNSVKFTEKGSVHMRLLRRDRRHWELEVRDTGIGIPEDELPTIFEAFKQVDSTATRKYGGFGLGLSIIKLLTELMKGSISVKSELGVGSTFTITLPLNQPRRRSS